MYTCQVGNTVKNGRTYFIFPGIPTFMTFLFPLNMQFVVKFLLSKIMSMYLEAKNNNRNKNSIRMIFIVTNTYLVYFLHLDPKIVFSALHL